MADFEQAVESKAQGHEGERYFMRFTRAQRYMHAVLFTTFLGLAATGLPMRFSESFWAGSLPAAWADSGPSSSFTSSSRWF